jgi:hypothetical protein
VQRWEHWQVQRWDSQWAVGLAVGAPVEQWRSWWALCGRASYRRTLLHTRCSTHSRVKGGTTAAYSRTADVRSSLSRFFVSCEELPEKTKEREPGV